MEDALENIKHRYRINNLAYQNPTGVMELQAVCDSVTEIFEEKFKRTDEDILTRLQNGIDQLAALNRECHDKYKEWASNDEWVEACCWFLFKRPRAFKAKWTGWLGAVFDVLDQDQDGYINEDEFSFFYQSTCRGADKAWITRAFRCIDLSNSGQVSRKQYVRAYVRYFTDPDITYEDLPLY